MDKSIKDLKSLDFIHRDNHVDICVVYPQGCGNPTRFRT